MVLLATTVKQDLVARLAPHHLELINSLIEAEVLRNDTVRKQLTAKVNETLKGFGIQDISSKPGK
jgi:predicted kinase